MPDRERARTKAVCPGSFHRPLRLASSFPPLPSSMRHRRSNHRINANGFRHGELRRSSPDGAMTRLYLCILASKFPTKGPPGLQHNLEVSGSTPKHKIDRSQDTKERSQVIPFQRLLQIQNRKYREYNQGDDFLDHLQLKSVEPFHESDPVGWDLKTVFKKGNAPADDNHLP